MPNAVDLCRAPAVAAALQKGFTLLEMLVVLVIIGLWLALSALSLWAASTHPARLRRRPKDGC
jgi:prepilin-type N-terminal cleavage/methylation domain-containing protein